jgi:hypothetical protein
MVLNTLSILAPARVLGKLRLNVIFRPAMLHLLYYLLEGQQCPLSFCTLWICDILLYLNPTIFKSYQLSLLEGSWCNWMEEASLY